MTATKTETESMSEITVVEFETSPHGGVYLSELSDGPPYTVHGVALGAGDVTVGQSGVKKKWPADELKQAADSLKGTNLVEDHNNGASGVVGRVTKAGYKEETGVVYEAELHDEDLAEKVQNGLLEVSIRGYHADVDSLEEDEETEAKIVEDIQFDNLSIVPTGASPSNTLEMGSHDQLSAAELSAFTDDLDEAELEGIEPGMWVQWGDKRGITISQIKDGEIEVDVYAESDGKWRSTGSTEMVSTDDLSEWDVDEEEDIGERKEDSDEQEDESDEEEQDEEENAPPKEFMFESEDEARAFIEDEDMLTGVHEMDGMWMPGADHEEFTEWHEEKHSEENASVQRGEFVKWKDVDNSWRHGQLIGIEQDGSQMVGTLRLFTEDGDKLDDTEKKPLQGLDKWDKMAENNDPDDMRDDSQGVEPPSWDDGQMVKWQVNPSMKGKIVHVDREKKVLMVEVMESTEQGLQPTGFTLTAGYSDVVPMSGESAATTTRDTPVQDAEPTHDTGVKGMLEQFLDEHDGENPTLSEFADWMEKEELSFDEPEGAEDKYESEPELDEAHEGEPHRYIDGDEDEELEEEDEASADEGRNVVEDVSDVEELQEYEMHTPSWDGTTESDWSTPNLEDFPQMDGDSSWKDLSDSDKEDIGTHFLISSSGFPADEYGDMKLPVVEPNGDLSLNALAAVKGGRGVSAVDGLASDMEEKIVGWVNETANEEFDKDWSSKEENAAADESEDENDAAEEHEIDGTAGRPTPQTQRRLGGVRVLSGDDLRQRDKPEASDVDSLTTQITTMTDNIEEKLSELDEPVAVEADEVEELRDKADRFEEMSENLEALRERTDILDEVSRDQVEELADSEEPRVVESARYEELQSEAEQVKTVYAASLAEEMPAFSAEELSDKFSIESLREKFEEHIGDVEEELASSESAEPRSQDPSEEELEEAAEENGEEADEAELSDQVEEKQAEIRDKILGGN